MISLYNAVVGALVITNLVLLSSLIRLNPSKAITGQFSGELVDSIEVYRQFPIDLTNASAVFNTVQAALKEKDSNIHPIGVSFIPAYIPANTRLYHSREDGEIPDLFEWIAFDYEFSYSFARFSRSFKQPSNILDNLPFAERNHLLTFRTLRPLDKIIFLDGASAAKLTPEMDQQMILSRQHNISAPVHEAVAAEEICKWGKSFGLQGFIRLEIGYEMILCDFHKDVELISNITLNIANDVINFPPDDPMYYRPPGRPQKEIREEQEAQWVFLNEKNYRSSLEEHAFEVPVNYSSPDFNRSLLLDHIRTTSGYEWLQSGSWTDNGDRRILLDFSSMVTPLNQTFIDPNPYKRNISYISNSLKEQIIYDLETVFQHPVDTSDKTNWQILTQKVVNKFGPLLLNLNDTVHQDDIKLVGDGIEVLTFNLVRRYLDGNTRDWQSSKKLAVADCIKDYTYHTHKLRGKDILIYSSLHRVNSEIVNLVFDLFELANNITQSIYVNDEMPDINLKSVRLRISLLLQLLNWATSYRCNEACKKDEICYTPTWGPGPFGWKKRDPKFFDFDGETYRIKQDLSCVGYKTFSGRLPPL